MMPGMPKGRTHDYQCHGITSIASLVAGLAPDFPVLLTGRVLQGAGAAVVGPRGCYIASSRLGEILGVHAGASVGMLKDLEELTADCSLEAALRVARGLPLGDSAGDVRLRGRVEPHADQRDGVQGPVELSVTAAVEPVPVGQPGGGRYWRYSGEGRESGLGPETARKGPADQDLGRGDRPDAEQVKVNRPGFGRDLRLWL